MYEQIEDFYDNMVHEQLMGFWKGNLRVKAALNHIQNAVGCQNPTRILDLGAGIGWTSYQMSLWYPNAMVVGVDISGELVAASQFLFSTPNLNFIQLNVCCDDLTEKVGTDFDLVVLADFYEHIAVGDRDRFASNLKAVLSDYGKMVVTCPTLTLQQSYRLKEPEKLQPVDEDVSIGDLQYFANSIDSRLTYFSVKRIWQNFDYFHAVLQYGSLAFFSPYHEKVNKKEQLTRWRRFQICNKILKKPFGRVIIEYAKHIKIKIFGVKC